MSSIYTASFWKDAFDRAVRTAAQTAAAALGGDVVNAWSVDWQTVSGLAGGAAALSLLMSLGAERFGPRGTPALTKPDA